MDDVEITLVSTLAECAEFLAWCEERTGYVACDTETTGLDWWSETFACRLVQFGTRDRAYVIPVAWYGRCISQALSLFAANIDLDVVFHNAPYDIHVLQGAGFPPLREDQVRDTNLIHRLTNPASFHSLKGISRGLVDEQAADGQGLLKALFNKYNFTWATVPVEHPIYWGYAGLDVILTSRVYDLLDPPEVASDLEHAYQNIMIRAETRGMRVDMEYTLQLADEWTNDCTVMAQTIRDTFGIENPASNQMVEAALREMGWVPTEFTEKSGQAKLDKAVFARLQDFGGPRGELASLLVEYNRKSKWVSTYLNRFLESDGVVHPGVNTMEAKTGRSSITNPPMQTLPHTPHIRNCILPWEGDDLWAIDYRGQEARIVAAYAKEEKMIEFFNGDDGDIHSFVGRMLYGEAFTPEQRDNIKTYNFASLYRAGPAKLAVLAGVPEVEMQRLIDDYDRAFPAIRRFFRTIDDLGGSRLRDSGEGFVKTLGGRKVSVLHDDDVYCLTNYVIQGSGADVLKQAVVRLDAAGLGDYIVLPVHDELLFSLPQGPRGAGLAVEIAELMTDRTSLSVPLTVDVTGPLSRWGEAYEESK